MIAYLLRRLLLTIPTLLGITLIVFTLTRFVPGGPIEKMMTDAQFAGDLRNWFFAWCAEGFFVDVVNSLPSCG